MSVQPLLLYCRIMLSVQPKAALPFSQPGVLLPVQSDVRLDLLTLSRRLLLLQLRMPGVHDTRPF